MKCEKLLIRYGGQAMVLEASPAPFGVPAYRGQPLPRPQNVATSVLSLAGHWLIARVKSREERAVGERLAKAGVGVYLPMVTATRRRTRMHRGQRRTVRERVELAAFPTYLFAACDGPAATDALYEARDVFQVMPVADQDQLRRELDQIQRALTVNSELRSSAWISKGKWARIIDGPFRGLVGTVDSRNGHRVFLLEVGVLGASVELEVADNQIEPSASPPGPAWKDSYPNADPMRQFYR